MDVSRDRIGGSRRGIIDEMLRITINDGSER